MIHCENQLAQCLVALAGSTITSFVAWFHRDILPKPREPHLGSRAGKRVEEIPGQSAGERALTLGIRLHVLSHNDYRSNDVLVPWSFLRSLTRAQVQPIFSPERIGATYPTMQPCPPSRKHVLAEPGWAPTAPLPSCGINDLQVGTAHDPVGTELGRLSWLPGLGVTHACQERNRK